MAKKSSIERNNKRIRMADQQRAKRNELRALSLDPKASDEEREAARNKLHKLPSNGSDTRVRRRCLVTGRPRGVYRKFSLCRIKIREYANMGFLPGVTKSSW